MGLRDEQEVHITEDGWEQHPAFGQIMVNRVQGGAASLFDSEIRHNHYVIVKIQAAERQRHLNHDWIHGKQQYIEVAMSEAQWAAFVSSMNSSPVSCTITALPGQPILPSIPFAPRMQHSLNEVKGAAAKTYKYVREAFEKVKEKPNKGNIKNLEHALNGVENNLVFAANSMTEHAENVIQKARADIEAMVTAHAERLGIDPGELVGSLQLESGSSPDAV
jgi:hypothetical protein